MFFTRRLYTPGMQTYRVSGTMKVCKVPLFKKASMPFFRKYIIPNQGLLYTTHRQNRA